MGFLDRLFGNDRERAATQYAGHESASEKAARKRREGHRRNTSKAARQGQAWEDRDRARDGRATQRDQAGRFAFGEALIDFTRTYLGSRLGPMRGVDGNIHRGRPNRVQRS